MRFPRLSSIKTDEGILYFKVKSSDNIHTAFIEVLHDLRFPTSDIEDIDMCFTGMETHRHFKHEGYNINIIITGDYVHTIIEFKPGKKKELMNIIEQHFNL